MLVQTVPNLQKASLSQDLFVWMRRTASDCNSASNFFTPICYVMNRSQESMGCIPGTEGQRVYSRFYCVRDAGRKLSNIAVFIRMTKEGL